MSGREESLHDLQHGPAPSGLRCASSESRPRRVVGAPRPSEAGQHGRPRGFSSQPLSWPRRLLALAIRGYQRFVSPFFPPTCRFEPHCSAYGHEAVLVHGALKGSLLIVWRVLRCQPFCRGGFDPVPERGRWR